MGIVCRCHCDQRHPFNPYLVSLLILGITQLSSDNRGAFSDFLRLSLLSHYVLCSQRALRTFQAYNLFYYYCERFSLALIMTLKI